MDRLKVLNRNQIKYILIIAMLIDHIAWVFIPTGSLLGQVMHFIGRITSPGMAILLAEGYVYTRSRMNYAIRLLAFSVLSWPAFTLMEWGAWPVMKFGVMFTLFLAFIAIWIWDEADISWEAKLAILALIVVVSSYGDWAYSGVMWAFSFWIFRDSKKKKWIAFSLIALFHAIYAISSGNNQFFQIGVFLTPLLMLFYNGESGSKNEIHKWFFYIFYPLHMLILFFIGWHLGCYK